MFEELNKYKRVDSGGRYLNNIGRPEGVRDKFAFQSEHKFSLTFENSAHLGYTTEKLLQGFSAGTIPIYWGDPAVENCFNPKAFINISGNNAVSYTHLDVYKRQVLYCLYVYASFIP